MDALQRADGRRALVLATCLRAADGPMVDRMRRELDRATAAGGETRRADAAEAQLRHAGSSLVAGKGTSRWPTSCASHECRMWL